MLQGCMCVIIIGWCMTIFNRAPIEDTAKVTRNNARCKSLMLDGLFWKCLFFSRLSSALFNEANCNSHTLQDVFYWFPKVISECWGSNYTGIPW